MAKGDFEVKVENEWKYFEVLHAPYVKGFTEGLQRRLRRLNIGFVPKSRELLYTNLCKMKTKVNFDDCKDVVYSIPCRECRLRYIGETGQHFCDRVGQHKRDVKNGKMSNGFYAHMNKKQGPYGGVEICVFY